MDNLRFGDIVLLKFPFTDGETLKKRPALIINDFDDQDIIVCRITSRIYKTKSDVKIDNWKESGLKLPSVIRVHKLATLQKEMIESVMGRVENPVLKSVKDIFRNLTD